MTQYLILIPSDEDAWEASPPEARQEVYDEHGRFSALLEAHGHKILGGAELKHSREAKVVRGTPGALVITEGPYAEAVEQLSGYYLVESSDLDDLLQVCGVLTDAESAIEVRELASVDVSSPRS
jgi:hypothetical protein